MDEELSCCCPHCGGTITFDEYGEPVATAQLEPNQRAGVRGIVVEEATPQWQLNNYHSNNQAERAYLKYQAAQPLVTPKPQAEEEPPTDDEAITDGDLAITEDQLLDVAALSMANTQDLKDRNIL